MKKIMSVFRLGLISGIFVYLAIASAPAFAAPVATVLTVGLPHGQTAGYPQAVISLVADYMSSHLKPGSTASGPEDYVLLGKISHENVSISVGTNLYGGSLNPSGIFAGQMRGPLVAALVDIRSSDGTDEIALGDISVTQASSDGNLLGSTVSFSNLVYNRMAVGVKADGTLVPPGTPGTVKVARIVATASLIYFKCHDQAELDVIKNWVAAYAPFTMTFKVSVAGVQVGQATTGEVLPFPLAISPGKAGLGLTVSPAIPDGWRCHLYMSPSPSGPWTNKVSVLGPGQTFTVSDNQGPPRFFFGRLGN